MKTEFLAGTCAKSGSGAIRCDITVNFDRALQGSGKRDGSDFGSGKRDGSDFAKLGEFPASPYCQ